MEEGLKSSSDKVATDSKSSVCKDIFRFESFGKRFSKKALLYAVPQGFLISQYRILILSYQRKVFIRFVPSLFTYA